MGVCRGFWPHRRLESTSSSHRLEHHTIEYAGDRKSTRLNSSHLVTSYTVCCSKEKKKRGFQSKQVPTTTGRLGIKNETKNRFVSSAAAEKFQKQTHTNNRRIVAICE